VRLERIVVGVDGSGTSLAAVGWTASLAAALGARVVAVHALGLLEQMEPPHPDAALPAPPHAHRDEIRQRFEHDWCAPLDAAGVKSQKFLCDGTPVSVLLAVADEEHADLIVVGSRGLGGYPELLLGSTSTQVAQLAHCPVTVFPAAATTTS
jgi:nucleotide-binding universal stress UspA family protein